MHVVQRAPEATGVSGTKQKLLDALAEFRGNAPNLVAVPEDVFQEAIADIENTVRSGDEQAIAGLMDSLQRERERAQTLGRAAPPSAPTEDSQQAVQFSGWRFAGAVVGGILGTLLFPIARLGEPDREKVSSPSNPASRLRGRRVWYDRQRPSMAWALGQTPRASSNSRS